MRLETLKEPQIAPVVAWVVMAGIYVVERVILAFAGIRFNVEAVAWYWQVLDPELLTDHLIESLVYLHAQPPLLNLVLGMSLKLGPTVAYGLLHGLFLLLGLTLAMVLFAGLMEIGWETRTAALAVAVCALSPGWIVYENWFFYDFPSVVLLAAAFVALRNFGRTRNPLSLVLFVTALTGLAMARSLFHLAWVLGSIGTLLFIRPRLSPKQWFAALALPLVVVGGWYFKNQLVFGFFGSSSWLGLSLAKTATARLEPADREAMVEDGLVSRFALVEPFSPLEDYEAAIGLRYPDSEIQALGQRVKASGHPNFNHGGFVEVSNRCRMDAYEVILRRPSVYWESITAAGRRFFSSAVAYPPFLENLVVMAPVYYLGEKTWSSRPVVVLAFAGALLFSIFAGVKAFRSGNGADLGLRLWVIWTLLWVLVVGSMLEVGENHRFRFLVNPLVWLTLADGARRLMRRLQGTE